ncbi:hypothetical protein DPMN_159747 [Dreissena polymorpha]|uniref:Uncharacterized protein n=1 Tax=Dreissena polymorpha TaxID=45954 RepID=A0A9D4EJL1_DREPO|nr:hypothetical protein DPMN_159747 [Dreissena polymorpha]
MVNSTSADVTMNDKMQVEMSSFVYLGASLSKDGTSTSVFQGPIDTKITRNQCDKIPLLLRYLSTFSTQHFDFSN